MGLRCICCCSVLSWWKITIFHVFFRIKWSKIRVRIIHGHALYMGKYGNNLNKDKIELNKEYLLTMTLSNIVTLLPLVHHHHYHHHHRYHYHHHHHHQCRHCHHYHPHNHHHYHHHHQLHNHIISNGNRTEWSPIRSVIIRVINKYAVV